jgi:hypothetical protein
MITRSALKTVLDVSRKRKFGKCRWKKIFDFPSFLKNGATNKTSASKYPYFNIF